MSNREPTANRGQDTTGGQNTTDEQNTTGGQNTTSEQTNGDGDQRQFGTALVFAREFYPNANARIVGRLPAGITVSMLRGPAGQSVPVLTRPDEYEGYVVSLDFGPTAIYSFLFTKRFLPSDGRYAFGPDVTYFSSVLNLLEVPIQRVDET